jgi:hypothetical protein
MSEQIERREFIASAAGAVVAALLPTPSYPVNDQNDAPDPHKEGPFVILFFIPSIKYSPMFISNKTLESLDFENSFAFHLQNAAKFDTIEQAEKMATRFRDITEGVITVAVKPINDVEDWAKNPDPQLPYVVVIFSGMTPEGVPMFVNSESIQEIENGVENYVWKVENATHFMAKDGAKLMAAAVQKLHGDGAVVVVEPRSKFVVA